MCVISEINKQNLENAFREIRYTENDVAANNDIMGILDKPENKVVKEAYFDLKLKIDKVMDAILKSIE